MSERNDGGPAFPFRHEYEDRKGNVTVDQTDGMSLRDYFAAQALIGVLAAEAHPNSHGAIPVDDNSAQFYALNCYRFADAMLKAREA